MVAWQKGEVVDVPLDDVAGEPRLVDPKGSLVAMARGLGICFGDESDMISGGLDPAPSLPKR
jgi:6-phosphofructokinase 1